MHRPPLAFALLLLACTPSVEGLDDGISSLAVDDEADEAEEADESESADDATTDLKFDMGEDAGDMQAGDTGEPECEMALVATVRDFQVAHPDFEDFLGTDLGIVQFMLGPDQKPVYAGNPTTPTTTGVDTFNQWYRDVPGVNQSFELMIPLTDLGNGTYSYSNSAFFPIDGQGFGNEGNEHNFHFTLELHSEFTYEGGEVFSFTGDDDLFTFVNGRLGIDLGGVHGSMNGQIDMDAMAATLGIAIGETYTLDFFFAERHTNESNFRIDTTISCFTTPDIG
ncbi:fibro-slime domain-containing protein [Nannocystaceae bacterium ST9]